MRPVVIPTCAFMLKFISVPYSIKAVGKGGQLEGTSSSTEPLKIVKEVGEKKIPPTYSVNEWTEFGHVWL